MMFHGVLWDYVVVEVCKRDSFSLMFPDRLLTPVMLDSDSGMNFPGIGTGIGYFLFQFQLTMGTWNDP